MNAHRQMCMDQWLAQAAANGAIVVARHDPETATVAWPRPRVNHLLHFIIGLCTIGLWWIVWFALAVSQPKQGETRTVRVDPLGVVRKIDPHTGTWLS